MEDTRYLSTYMVWKERRNEYLDLTKLGDPPPASELIRSSSFVPLTTTTAAVAVTTQLWAIGITQYYYSTMEGLSLQAERETALLRPLC